MSFFVKDGLMLCSYCKKPTKEKTKFSDLKPINNKEAEKLLRKKGLIPENIDYKKFCEGVDKLCREIDDECEKGERQLRFFNNTYIADDIIKGGEA